MFGSQGKQLKNELLEITSNCFVFMTKFTSIWKIHTFPKFQNEIIKRIDDRMKAFQSKEQVKFHLNLTGQEVTVLLTKLKIE
jgi:hypothetical protein